MPDTFTTNYGFTKPEVSGSVDTWGGKLNDNLDVLDAMFGGVWQTILGASDVTLSEAEAQYILHDLSGTLSANVNVIVPNKQRRYIFHNRTSGAFTVTVKTAEGAGVEVRQGWWAYLYCDGTDVIEIGVPAHTHPSMDISDMTGEIKMYGGSTPPPGWLLCDGSEVSREDYAALFAVIGTAYGEGNGVTTFNLPNFCGRTPVGAGTGKDEEGNDLTARALGDSGGEEKHTLTTSEIPAHTHSGTAKSAGDHSHTVPIPRGHSGGGTSFQHGPTDNSPVNVSSSTNGAHTHVLQINQTGGNGAHNNMQPFLVVNFIIKT